MLDLPRCVVAVAVFPCLLLSGCMRRAEAAALPPSAALSTASSEAAPVARFPLDGLKIVLDPGHGSHTGAVSAAGDWEDDNVLDIAERTAALLRADGAAVWLTRTGPAILAAPDDSDLQVRVADATRWNADVLVSIHENWAPSPDLRGVETFWETPSSAALAQSLQRGLVAGTGLQDQGVEQRDFWVVSCVPMPAVLVEVGYLSNPEEGALISGLSFHAREAQALRHAIDSYFATPGAARGPQPPPPAWVGYMCGLDPVAAKAWLQAHPAY